jgi:hypothetical protein
MTPAEARAILGSVRGYTESEWRRVRAAGQARFLLRHGLLGRGLPLGTLTAVVVKAAQGGRFPEDLATLGFLGLLAFCVAVFTASGSLAARASWGFHERRYPDAR